MLETPSIQRYSSMSHPLCRVSDMDSDKPSGADNQQERPGFAQWVVGFVDGEGCFSVPIFRNPTCRLGWQVQPTFTVVQGEKSLDALHRMKRFFGCGHVGRNGRHDNHREPLYRLVVRKRSDLSEHILPFFESVGASLYQARIDAGPAPVALGPAAIAGRRPHRQHYHAGGLHMMIRAVNYLDIWKTDWKG